MALANPAPSRLASYRAAGVVMLGALGVIIIALLFEHVGGYKPCELCLMERWAYYAGIPLAFVAMVLLSVDYPRIACLVLVAVGLAFLANAGLGVYHAGAEWQFWLGPSTCGGSESLTSGSGNLLNDLGKERVIRCDRAPWRMLGLSFAGWNVVTSAVLAIAAFQAAYEATVVAKN